MARTDEIKLRLLGSNYRRRNRVLKLFTWWYYYTYAYGLNVKCIFHSIWCETWYLCNVVHGRCLCTFLVFDHGGLAERVSMCNNRDTFQENSGPANNMFALCSNRVEFLSSFIRMPGDVDGSSWCFVLFSRKITNNSYLQ